MKYEEKVLPTRMELDVYYVKHMGVFFDTKVIWWTVVCIVNSITNRDSNRMLKELKGFVKKTTDKYP